MENTTKNIPLRTTPLFMRVLPYYKSYYKLNAMPSYTIKEFADICGVEPKNIHTWITRGKVIKTDKGLIDIYHPTNKEFLQKRTLVEGKQPVKKGKSPARKKVVLPKVEPEIDLEPATGTNDSGVMKLDSMTMAEMEMLHKRVVIDKNIVQIDLLQLQKEKHQGLLIPVELVYSTMTQQNQSYVSAFKNATERLIIEFTKIAGISNEHQAEMRGRMIEAINEASADADERTANEIQNIINVYVLKKKV